MNRSRLPPLRHEVERETDVDDRLDSQRSESPLPESPASRGRTATPDKPRRKKKPVTSSDGELTNRSQPTRPKPVPAVRTNVQHSENESPDDTETAQPKPKKKRKPQTVAGSQEQLVASSRAPNSNPPTTRKKRKRPSRQAEPRSDDIGLASELYDLEEDIVKDTVLPPGAAATTEPAVIDPRVTIAVMRSEPTQQLYTETKRGFKATDKTKLAMKRAQAAEAVARLPPETQRTSTIEFALLTHRVFKTCAVFLQGMFSGLTLWQIIASYMLIIVSSVAFVQYYHQLALPVQSIYFFFFAVATVSALDRYDLARPTRKLFIKSITMQAGTICVLFFFCGLIVSLGTAPLDEMIGLNDTALWDNQQSGGCQWLCQWQILNVIRGVLAILGWFVISLRPETDRLTKSLIHANDDILPPDNNATINNTTQPVDTNLRSINTTSY